MFFIRAMVHIFPYGLSPHENICAIALITIQHLYTIAVYAREKFDRYSQRL